MHHSSYYDRRHTNDLTQSMSLRIRVQRIFSLTISILVVTSIHIASAQLKIPPARDSALCNRENAVETIRQQIDFTKTFDNTTHRIAVLIRAADLLWTYEPDKAHSAFAEALELARQNFEEKGDRPNREASRLWVDTPDQRYIVITAIAKRDPAWAKTLTEQMLKKEASEAVDNPTSNREQTTRTAQHLLISLFVGISVRQQSRCWRDAGVYDLPCARGIRSESLITAVIYANSASPGTDGNRGICRGGKEGQYL